MPQIDPVILRMRADLDAYHRDVRNSTRLVQGQLGQQEQAVTRLERQSARSAKLISGSFAAIGAALSVGAFVQLGREAVETAVRVRRIEQAMKAASGSAAEANKNLQFATETADRLGLVALDVQEGLTGITAAARGTSLEGDQVREIFEAVTRAGVTFGASAEQVSGALTAVEQIISKGKVSAEELRGQLGERLPGAFQIAARAMGVTTGELDKMLASGELLAEDFLPKFARQLGSELPNSVEAADAELNRLATTLDEVKATVADEFIDDLNDAAGDLRDTLQQMQQDGSLEAIGQGISFVVKNAVDGVGILGKFIQKLQEINDDPIANAIIAGPLNAISNASNESGLAYNRFARTGNWNAFGNSAVGADPRTPEGMEAYRQAAQRERARAEILRRRDNAFFNKRADEADRAAEAYERVIAKQERYEQSLADQATVSQLEREDGIFLSRDPVTDFDPSNPFGRRSPANGGGGGGASSSRATKPKVDNRTARERYEDRQQADVTAQRLANQYGENYGEYSALLSRMAKESNERLAEMDPALVQMDARLGDVAARAAEVDQAIEAAFNAEQRERLQRIGEAFEYDLAAGLADVLVYGDDIGDVLENSFKRVTAALIETTLQLQVIEPLMRQIRGSGGGGIFSAIGGILGFGGGRAAGGPVSAGTTYLVGEQGPELFRPATSGMIMPNHQLRAADLPSGFVRPRGGVDGQQVTVRLALSGDIDARIDQRAANVSVQVVKEAAPGIADAGAARAFEMSRRPEL